MSTDLKATAGVATTAPASALVFGADTAVAANPNVYTTTGSGNVVLSTSPTLVTPALGTPASGTLTNATGLPISTGLTGAGTGVLTALGVNVGSAGSPVVNGGALGTPSGGTLTNCTGLPIAGTTGWGTGVATAAGNAVNGTGGLITFAAFAPASGKVLTVSNSITLAGTDSTTMTFPSTSATIARTDAANTFTGDQTFSANVICKQAYSATQTLTDAATVAWDMNSGAVAKVTLGGNRTLGAPSNLKDGGTYVLRVIQDGTGSRTLAYNAVFKWPGGVAPVLSVTAGAIDVLTFVSDGTNLYGVAQKAFA